MRVRALSFAVIWTSAAFGQQSAALSLADCIRLATSAPSTISLARQDVRIAAAGVRAARANFLPQSALSGGAIYNTPTPDRQAFVSYNGPREYLTLAGVSVELDTSGRLRAAYGRAKVDQELAQTSVQLSERDLRRAVTISFYRVLLARKLAAAAQESLTEAQSFEARVKALVAGGEAAQADGVKATAQTVSFEQLKRATDLDARVANQELASYWTQDVDRLLDLEDTLAVPPTQPAPTDAAGAFLRRAEFRLFDLQRQGFKFDAKRERAALLPQVTLGYLYGVDVNRYDWRQRGTALTATLTIPIFDWFRAKSVSQQFALRAEQVDTTRQIAERTFSREYEAAKARTDSVLEQVRLAQSQVTLFEDNLRLSRVRYEGGEGPALDVVVAQSQLQQARANYFTTLFQYANARADLEVAAGR